MEIPGIKVCILKSNSKKTTNYQSEFNTIHDLLVNSEGDIFILKDNMILVNNNFSKLLTDVRDENYDVVWFNKVKDECEYHIKINDHLRKSRRPGSIQAVYINGKTLDFIKSKDIMKEVDLIKLLNSLTLTRKTAVTANNYFMTDMNSVTSIKDFESFIECDYPYKKDKLYNSSYKAIIFLIFFLVIVLFSLYLYFVFSNDIK